MKEFLKKSISIDVILNFVKTKTFAYIITALFAFIAFNNCKSKQDVVAEKNKIEQNIIASNDTAKYYKNKNGELVTEKTLLILSIKELKKEKNELYDKIKDQVGSIISLNSVILSLKQDTTLLREKLRNSNTKPPTKINDSTWVVNWDLLYKWDDANFDNYVGRTKIGISGNVPLNTIKIIDKGSELTQRTSNIDLTFGEKVVDGKYNVYVVTSYPGLTAKSLEGVFIDPNTNDNIKKLIKKKHWFTGWSVGIGVVPGYNLIDGKFGLTVGPTLNFNIYQW